MELLKIGELKTKRTTLLSDGESYNPEFIVTNNLDTELYNDITSNVNWFRHGINYYDYLFCRKQIMFRTAIIGFSSMTQDDKVVASKVFAVGKSDRDTVHTENEQINNWDTFVLVSQKTRQQRWGKAKSYISYLLNPIDSTDLALSTETYSKNYIEYGIEALDIDGVNGLYDWLNNDFTQKTYYNETYKNNILYILQYGFY